MKFNGREVKWWEPLLFILALSYIAWFMVTGGR